MKTPHWMFVVLLAAVCGVFAGFKLAYEDRVFLEQKLVEEDQRTSDRTNRNTLPATDNEESIGDKSTNASESPSDSIDPIRTTRDPLDSDSQGGNAAAYKVDGVGNATVTIVDKGGKPVVGLPVIAIARMRRLRIADDSRRIGRGYERLGWLKSKNKDYYEKMAAITDRFAITDANGMATFENLCDEHADMYVTAGGWHLAKHGTKRETDIRVGKSNKFVATRYAIVNLTIRNETSIPIDYCSAYGHSENQIVGKSDFQALVKIDKVTKLFVGEGDWTFEARYELRRVFGDAVEVNVNSNGTTVEIVLKYTDNFTLKVNWEGPKCRGATVVMSTVKEFEESKDQSWKS